MSCRPWGLHQGWGMMSRWVHERRGRMHWADSRVRWSPALLAVGGSPEGRRAGGQQQPVAPGAASLQPAESPLPCLQSVLCCLQQVGFLDSSVLELLLTE